MQTPQDQSRRPTPGAQKALPARFWNLTCWLHQRLIAHYSDTMQSLPTRTQRHLRACLTCSELHVLERDLARRLAGEAKPQRHSPSPFLHARIMASLERPISTASPRFKPLTRPTWTTAFLLIGFALFSI